MTAADEVGHGGDHVLAKQVFKADLESLSEIRDFVGKWAAEVGLGEEQVYRIKLAVSEACANAIEHPKEKSDITLWVWNRADRFTVDVWHAGEFQVKTGQDRGHRGMGLPLMVASADEVSFACLPEGGTRVSLSVFLKLKEATSCRDQIARPGSGLRGEGGHYAKRTDSETGSRATPYRPSLQFGGALTARRIVLVVIQL